LFFRSPDVELPPGWSGVGASERAPQDVTVGSNVCHGINPTVIMAALRRPMLINRAARWTQVNAASVCAAA
jgi:hypothetical protein